MATVYEELQQRMIELSGRCWVERLVVQGQPDGIRGAQVTLGWEARGIGGATRAAEEGPYPLDAIVGDPAYDEILEKLGQQALQQLVETQNELNAANQLVLEKDAAIRDLQALLTQVQQMLESLQAAQ